MLACSLFSLIFVSCLYLSFFLFVSLGLGFPARDPLSVFNKFFADKKKIYVNNIKSLQVPDGLKKIVQKEKNNTRAFTGAELRVRLTSFSRFVDPKVDTSNMDVDTTETEAEEKSPRKKKKAHKKKKETEEEDLL